MFRPESLLRAVPLVRVTARTRLLLGVDARMSNTGRVQASPASRSRRDPSPHVDRRQRQLWIWTIGAVLLLAVGLVFGQTVHHQFLDDDDQVFVYRNPNVTGGLTLSGIRWAFADGPYHEWTPLACLSHMLDCQLYGLEPGRHHLTNVLLHGASSVLLLVLLRMAGDLWPNSWVAAAFAVHPLHVESVAWVSERKDVLSGLFFMLTLGAYALFVERRSLPRYLAVFVCLAMGLMSKPMLVTLPFLLQLDYWPLDRFRAGTGARTDAASGSWLGRLPVGWRPVMEKVPLMGLAAASCGIALSTHVSWQSTRRPSQKAYR